ncbi:YihY/virulence factor BrkB family protein [Aeoliella sp. ICT_H6.2]|uniref:YihY/virulence factor BrkB family protein n=1 Tax=Aeoliella straminimaris TaxID=2954799 RepID=A0A9X2JGY6_9BACT|nr:YihY/virulence factor BrkB family protein [Aeoliella straminimaris]MCO6042359.1 YihY/virulence factor BrkB family protein [Aeoliella straminimaris]
MFAFIRSTAIDFNKHHCMQMAAAIAYGMIFSLPGLLLISTTTVAYVARTGALGGSEEVEERMVDEIESAVGPINANQIREVIDHSKKMPTSTVGFLIGVGVLLISASGVVAQVQVALNTIWSEASESPRGRNRNFLVKRLLSIASVMVMALLLVASLVMSTLFAAFGETIDPLLPPAVVHGAQWLTGTVTNLLVSWLVFTAIYKWLPDVRVGWKDAWRGGLLTAGMFWVGRSVLAALIARLGIGSAYGAAGSLVVLLSWLYYSAIVFLLGAEMTRHIEDRAIQRRKAKKEDAG